MGEQTTLQWPTPELLRQMVRYEPDTGNLFWLPRPKELFSGKGRLAEQSQLAWNSHYAGQRAFANFNSAGYFTGKIFRRKYLAHRVAWTLMAGEWPVGEIDHINRIRHDNRWCNLRVATVFENRRNTGRQSNNSSGIKGVCWNKKANKWMAQIAADKRRRNLGCFSSIEDAAAAYARANAELHGAFGNLA